MATGNQPLEEALTAKDVERAERRAAAARQRAAHAGLSAARSFEESALGHERVARVQDEAVEQGVSHVGVHRESAVHHREFAAEDRKLAELKRKESEADLAVD
ncbi:hypothetical protein A5692_05005 [Mycobacterium sp. E342]|uniref:hypothetical protein n=1 Tax=Mycobacterium sp. E342 TaxID=1834147 RepID=UPI0008019F61|nr:hypothetical protein [Mycobacterium sp. E342]OBH24405.1 hypothetical protein A5692_05005 [Mycobacterium sp. E342]